ncbi:MAG: hypothetical protein KKA79_09975, partial [Nanoarchaeota archaeon]|nr:hypothetical protein [Nanoarchaeota archaeon]
MRIYKKWKNLKPDVKVGLACTAFYFASLATPIYAAAEKELRDPVQPINLEQVINVPQVETLYKEKLAEYSQDKIIEDIEIENLYKIHQKRIVLLKEESATLSKEYSEKWESKLNKLDVKKINLESNLNSGEDLSVLSDVKKGLDKDILRYYPALFESDGGNLNYAADTQLNSELEESFRKLVIEANAILLQYYNDDGLKLLVDKDCYDLNDIAILHNMLNKEKHTDENKRAAVLKKIVDTKLE